jgi:PRTRC genetic system ThiF family protein
MLNFSYLEALALLARAYEDIDLYLVGCGGTGSYVAPFLARFAKFSKLPVRLTFVDPKPVREKNLIRQNFSPAELGIPKSIALATRYALAWGLEIKAIDGLFTETGQHWNRNLTFIVGCVDNAAARRSILNSLVKANRSHYSQTWWLDSGNHYSSGQVAIGNAIDPDWDSWRSPLGVLDSLPAPSLQFPGLLEDLPQTAKPLSCEDMVVHEAQSQTINMAIASHVCDYVSLFFANKLTKFQTVLDMPSGTAQSYYNSPQELAKYSKTCDFVA